MYVITVIQIQRLPRVTVLCTGVCVCSAVFSESKIIREGLILLEILAMCFVGF